MIRLEPEEIGELPVIQKAHIWEPSIDDIAKAQLKKMAEWGDSICIDKRHSGTMKKRECGFCWQSILEEVI